MMIADFAPCITEQLIGADRMQASDQHGVQPRRTKGVGEGGDARMQDVLIAPDTIAVDWSKGREAIVIADILEGVQIGDEQ
mgnify:CR=1 FL=1